VRVIERSGNPPRTRRAPDFGDGGYDNGRSSFGSYERRQSVDPATLPRLEGVVRRFDPERGFGFISSPGAPQDVFFHGSVVVGDPVSRGDSVEFRLTQGQRGPRAQEVRLVERG
jgi:CspA family cold shock protein